MAKSYFYFMQFILKIQSFEKSDKIKTSGEKHN